MTQAPRPRVGHDVRMGVLFDYFSAACDEAAASTISFPGGPGRSAAQPTRSGFKIRRSRAPQQPVFDTVPVKGIDPLVQLGTLEALLTGQDYDQIVAGPRAGHVLANQDGGQRLVVTLTPEIQAALADADAERLASVAIPWSQTDEFWGQGDPDILAGLFGELADLARRARARNESLYCWVSV